MLRVVLRYFVRPLLVFGLSFMTVQSITVVIAVIGSKLNVLPENVCGYLNDGTYFLPKCVSFTLVSTETILLSLVILFVALVIFYWRIFIKLGVKKNG